jgi:hypothetical protein
MKTLDFELEFTCTFILLIFCLIYIIYTETTPKKVDLATTSIVLSSKIDSIKTELNTLRGEATSLNFWISGMKEDGKTFPVIIKDQVYSYYNTKDRKHLDSLIRYADIKSKEYSEIED